MTDIQKATPSGLTVKLVSEMTGFDPAEIALVSKTVAVGAPLQELAVFLRSCRALGLDPILRQVYWIRRKQRDGSYKGALQVGIDGFRAIAEASGMYAGAEAIEYRGSIEWTYKGKALVVPELARATLWKIVGGHKSAFVGEAYWTEFVPATEGEAFMWQKMPRLMLGKCAEAQALRRAFPAQLGSLTITPEVDADAQVAIAADDAERTRRNAQRYDEIFTPEDERPTTRRPLPPPEDDDIPEEVPEDDDD